MPTKERTATLVEDVSFTVRARVTVDGLDAAPEVGRNVRNIFSAMVAGSSDTDERETWFRERMEQEIKATHPEVLYAEVLVCTSDDPTDHQGLTCPVHERVETNRTGMISFSDIIEIAAYNVSEDNENTEYDRALFDLIAQAFGIEEMPTDERMSEVRNLVLQRKAEVYGR